MVARKTKEDPKFDGKKYAAEFRERIMKGSADKLALQSQVVSRHFTLHELQALNLFFKAPLGKKLVDETPKIQREMLMRRRATGLNMPGASMTAHDKSQNDDEDEDEETSKSPAKPKPKK